MGKSVIESTFLVRSRGALSAVLGASLGHWSPHLGDPVTLVSPSGDAFELKIIGLETLCPGRGRPCLFAVSLAPPSGDLEELIEIDRVLKSRSDEIVALEWGATSSTG